MERLQIILEEKFACRHFSLLNLSSLKIKLTFRLPNDVKIDHCFLPEESVKVFSPDALQKKNRHHCGLHTPVVHLKPIVLATILPNKERSWVMLQQTAKPLCGSITIFSLFYIAII